MAADTSDTSAAETVVAPDVVDDVTLDIIEEVTPDTSVPDIAIDIEPDVAPDVPVGPCDGDPCAADPDATCVADGLTYSCVCANDAVLGANNACGDVIDVSISFLAVCALQRDGRLACWGENGSFSPVPGGAEGEFTRPIAVPGVWDQVSVGTAVSCGLQQGALSCWGKAASIFGDDVLYTEPTRIGTLDDWSVVRTDRTTVCGIRGGKAYCWGANSQGQLGVGDKDSRDQPTEVAGDISGWSTLVLGGESACGIVGGALYCWGGRPGASFTVPTRVGTREDWTDVVAGDGHYCALGAGEVLCMGYNSEGGLGDGTTTSRGTFEREQSASTYASVIAGGGSTCARQADSGAVSCWGTAFLADGADAMVMTTPTAAPVLSEFDALYLGSQLGCGVKQGQLSCWGSTGSARLGDGTPEFLDPPAPFPAPPGTSGWSLLSTVSNVGCGIADGGLYCWGLSQRGLLGLGDVTSVWTPTRVGSANDWSFISVGANEACGLRAGVRYCWGWNRSGGVGDGTLTQRSAPLPLGPDSDWTKFAMSSNSGCGLKAGALYCWGRSELVSAVPNAEVLTPTRIGSATDWTDVTTGRRVACGIRAGELYCWGSAYDFSQTSDIVAPTRIGNLSTWSDVEIGGFTACGLAGGWLYCWGSAVWGQIGDGLRVDSPSPVAIGTDSDWTSVSVSDQATAAIKGGQLYVWGYNFNRDFALGPNLVTDTSGLTSVVTGYTNAFVMGAAGAGVYGTNRQEAGLGNRNHPSAVTMP